MRLNITPPGGKTLTAMAWEPGHVMGNIAWAIPNEVSKLVSPQPDGGITAIRRDTDGNVYFECEPLSPEHTETIHKLVSDALTAKGLTVERFAA